MTTSTDPPTELGRPETCRPQEPRDRIAGYLVDVPILPTSPAPPHWLVREWARTIRCRLARAVVELKQAERTLPEGTLSHATGEVLVELAEYHGAETRPSVATLASGRREKDDDGALTGRLLGGLGRSRSTVLQHLAILEALALVRRESRPGRPTLYTLVFDVAYPSDVPDGSETTQAEPTTATTTDPSDGPDGYPSGVPDPYPSGVPDPNVQENVQKNSGRAAHGADAHGRLAGFEWAQWVVGQCEHDLWQCDGLPANVFGRLEDGTEVLTRSTRRALAGVVFEMAVRHGIEDADAFVFAAEQMREHPQLTDSLPARFRAVLETVVVPRLAEGWRREPAA